MGDNFKEQLVVMVESMPAFPESVHQIMAMSGNANCSPKELVQVIERDPVMTMKILKLVNSAFFVLSSRVASVQHALVYLGLNTVKNLAVSIATVDALPRQSIPELPASEFLRHSLAVALVSQKLAKERLGLSDASDYFVAGLLHDFGKAVFIQFEPKGYAAVIKEARKTERPLVDVEMEHWGVSSAEVGAMLAESWQLPETLVTCIRTHASGREDVTDLALVVAAANIVVKSMRIGSNGDPCVGEFSESMQQRLDCDLESAVNRMMGLEEEINQLQNMVRG